MTDDPYAPGGIYYVNPEVPEECREEISLKEYDITTGKGAHMFCIGLSKSTSQRLDWDTRQCEKEILEQGLDKDKIVAKFNEIFSPWVTLID